MLIVEDDEDFVTELEALIAAAEPNADVVVARCREDACRLLDVRFFDLAVLDLNIPTQDGGLDADPAHGKLVFHHARTAAPGTKLLVLTGSPSEDFIADMLAQKHDADIWSEGTKVGTVEFLRKIDIVQADAIIGRVLTAITALDDVELDARGINLQTGEDRLVRIFAKKFAAARCVVSPIGAGRSGASTYRLQLHDSSGTAFQVAVGKLAALAKVEDESARYDARVALLDPASTPRKMATIEFGAGPIAGVFYQLAVGHDASLFSLLGTDDALAARAVESAAAALGAWVPGDAQARYSVAAIRRPWLDDPTAARLATEYGLHWATGLEAREIQTRWCNVHGDLHGENVLVSADGTSVVIDFGDVKHGTASYDPVTLSLSAVLQRNPTLSERWPTREQCRLWHDLDAYLSGSPIPLFVRACRAWAESRAAGRREVGASAYSYLLRQLKYDDTDKERILALMDGVRAYLAAT